MYYVYIIESLKDGSFYKGYTSHPELRLNQHNDGESNYTSFKGPWKLVHLEKYSTKTEALKREKVLKKYSHQQIKKLIESPKNHLANYVA
jgi:putative endonuclease